MNKPDLIAELKEAMMVRNRAQADLDEEMVRLAEAKAAIRERRDLLAAREKALREIEHELLTGEPSLPLLAAPAGRNGVAGPAEPARGDPFPPATRATDGQIEAIQRCVEEMIGTPGHRVAGDPSAWAEVIRPAGEGPPPACRADRDWRTVTVEELMASIGPAGGPIAANLRREYEIGTVDDLAEALRDSLFDWAEIPPAEAGAIRDAISTFRVDRGWTAETTWPDGIPAAWLDDDQGGAEEAASDLTADEERICTRPGNTAPHYVQKREQIRDYRERQARGDDEPQWDRWSEFGFDITVGIASKVPVRVLYEPDGMGGKDDLNFHWGAGRLEYRHHGFDEPDERLGLSLLEYARRAARHLIVMSPGNAVVPELPGAPAWRTWSIDLLHATLDKRYLAQLRKARLLTLGAVCDEADVFGGTVACSGGEGRQLNFGTLQKARKAVEAYVDGSAESPRRDPPAAGGPQAREPEGGWTDASIRAALDADPDLEIEIPSPVVPADYAPEPTGRQRYEGIPVERGTPAGAAVEQAGYRPCGIRAYRAAAPADRHPRYRAIRLLGEKPNAAQDAAVAAERAKPGECDPAPGEPGSRENPIRVPPADRRVLEQITPAIDGGNLRLGRVRAALQADAAAEARPLHVPAPAGGWDGTALYAAAVKLLGPAPVVSALHRLAVCKRCNGLNAPVPGKGLHCACSPDVRGGDMISYPSFAARIDDGVTSAVEERPDGGAIDGAPWDPSRDPEPSPIGRARDAAEWRSDDLDATLRAALGWGGAAERLTYPGRSAAANEILAELGSCWENANHIHKHAKGYRVRGGRNPAFWMGDDTSRKPTLEGAALIDRVRRVLAAPKPADPRPSGSARRKAARAKPPLDDDMAGLHRAGESHRAARAAKPADAPAPIAGGAPGLVAPPVLPSHNDCPRGFRRCTESEWYLAGAARRHSVFRLIREEAPHA